MESAKSESEWKTRSQRLDKGKAVKWPNTAKWVGNSFIPSFEKSLLNVCELFYALRIAGENRQAHWRLSRACPLGASKDASDVPLALFGTTPSSSSTSSMLSRVKVSTCLQVQLLGFSCPNNQVQETSKPIPWVIFYFLSTSWNRGRIKKGLGGSSGFGWSRPVVHEMCASLYMGANKRDEEDKPGIECLLLSPLFQ